MLYPTTMPLLTGLVLFGLSFLNAAAVDAVEAQDNRNRKGGGAP